MPTGIIDSLDHEGRGLIVVDGTTVFIEGALPGERVEYAVYRRKPTYELARTLRVLIRRRDRVTPRCPHFGVCGGCSMQHLDAVAQVAAKQRCSRTTCGISAGSGPSSCTRRFMVRPGLIAIARGCRFASCQERAACWSAFTRRRAAYVADMQQCEVLPPHLSALLLPLRELVGALSIRDRLPQIEVAVGEHMTALVLRILESPSAADEALLRDFADRHAVVFYLQPKGPATAFRFHPPAGPRFPICCPISPSSISSRRPSSRRSIPRSTACWCGGR
jgi:23S rRNA (uracil1939-C5)-methyltransferase